MRKLNDLVGSYSIMTPDLPNHLPPSRAVDHTIDIIPGSEPCSRPAYRMSADELAALREKLTELSEKGFIRPSISPYGAPVLFVPKKDGGLHFCVDWRMLNQQTVKNSYPLPRIDDLLDQLHGSTCYSKIDLNSAYYQVRIKEEDIHKTAFRTKYGLYEFTVLGMGLCNAPATFMRLMNDVLRPFLDKFVLCFLDDILIFSKTPEEHVEHVRLVLDALQQNELYAAPKKCAFGKTKVDFLGHVVSKDGITLEDKKVHLLQEWPRPKTVGDLRSFLGLANYYRQFVRSFSQIAAPLTELTKRSSSLSWGEVEQSAFEALKNALTSHPVLQPPNPEAPFFLHTDASDYATGAALMQKDSEGREYAVAYESKRLHGPEVRYTTHEKEQLSVVRALKHWRHHLKGRPFTLITDSTCVKHLPTQPTLSSRQARWCETLAEFEFEIVHRAGPLNVVPDAMSRWPGYQLNVLHATTISVEDVRDEILSAAEVDPKYQEVKSLVEANQSRDFSLANGLLVFRTDRVYVPNTETLRTRLLHEAHDAKISGHLGREKTYERLSRLFYWPKMRRSVAAYVRSCVTCQQIKPEHRFPPGLLQPLPVPPEKFHTYSLDFITQLRKAHRTQNDAILTIQDSCSKLLAVIPCKTTITAKEVANLFYKHISKRFGVPKVLVSDRDSKFTSAFWQSMSDHLGTELMMSTARHPQTDGQSEKANQTVEDMIRAYVAAHHRDWDQHLAALEFAYNDSKHASTGFTPFWLTYGQHPNTPMTLLRDQLIPSATPAADDWIETLRSDMRLAKAHITAAKVKQAHYANKHRRPSLNLPVGTKVLKKYHA